MGIKDKMRTALLDFLQIQPASENQQIRLQESVGFAADVIRNKVWYRGDPSELSQLAKQLSSTVDDTASTRFWAQVPEVGQLRKAHSGLPAVMVDTLAAVVKADLNEPEFDGRGDAATRWDEIAEENRFPEIVGQAITETLVLGDGAFKISIDPELSEHPLLEYFAADRVEYEMSRGRVTAVIFTSCQTDEDKQYTLRERYAPGSVSYELYDKEGNPCALADVPTLAELRDVHYDGDFMLAVPVRFFRSTKWPGRGRSIFDSKTDAFDALDEIVSQWIDAIRAGRVIRYIPDDLVPRSAENGTVTPLSYFQQNYIVTGSSLKEDAKSAIDMQQAEIRYDAFVASYAAVLDMCLQGIMSPATLGVNVGKMASADAQREKKDITGFTRGAITDALEKALPIVACTLLMADDLMQGNAAGSYLPPVFSFGEYGAPDFDSRVETVGKGRSSGIMSIEACVSELWGASKTTEEQEQEVARLKAEQGIDEEDEPMVAADAFAAVPGRDEPDDEPLPDDEPDAPTKPEADPADKNPPAPDEQTQTPPADDAE